MKLTLHLDEDLVAFVHKLARESGDSVSNVVASMFRDAQRRVSVGLIKSDAVKSLYGISENKPIPAKGKLKKRLLKKHFG